MTTNDNMEGIEMIRIKFEMEDIEMIMEYDSGQYTIHIHDQESKEKACLVVDEKTAGAIAALAIGGDSITDNEMWSLAEKAVRWLPTNLRPIP